MRLLALQAYDAASHRAFLDGWRRHSRHTFTVLALPGRHFKWRMRQAPIAFADQISTLWEGGERWDAFWCTSMLDLASLRGLCPAAAALPAAVYFHENQLAYPTRHTDPRDAHFGLTQMLAALAAAASVPAPARVHATTDAPACVWWNSAYNRDSFLGALDNLLDKMPDHRPRDAVDTIRSRSAVRYPGIDPIMPTRLTRADRARPPTLLWAARWEHDKGPELFFEVLDRLVERGIDFRLSVIGEQFDDRPACFDAARERFADRVVRWGYQPTREAYIEALREADIVVSTARHEFFGLAIAEAVSAGCVPVLPNALAYPEVWGDAAVYHDQTPAGVADAIARAIGEGVAGDPGTAERFAWPRVAKALDDTVDAILR